MSKFTDREQRRLERLFEMEGGYVLNFSDKTFATFFKKTIGKDIHHKKYCINGTSKAKKLRTFWQLEDSYTVGIIINELIEEIENNDYTPCIPSIKDNQEVRKLIKDAQSIANRLLSKRSQLDSLKQSIKEMDDLYLHKQIERAQSSINEDPELAIGTAKDLLETCCKTILEQRNSSIENTPKLPKLIKATLIELKLVPEAIPNEAKGNKIIRQLLNNIGAIANATGELRNLYGAGHGKSVHSKGLQPRHARLAVSSAATLTTFLFETHKETRNISN